MKASLNILVFSILFISASAYAGTAQVSCSPSKAKSLKTVKAHKNDLIVVSAQGNATTGYRWTSQEGHESQYIQDGQMRIGSGGVEVFEIEAKKDETLTFEYKRAWESKAIAVCKVKVVID